MRAHLRRRRPEQGQGIAHVPVWALHGDAGNAVPASVSREFVDARQKRRRGAEVHRVPEGGSQQLVPAFEEKEFWNWIFAQKREPKK